MYNLSVGLVYQDFVMEKVPLVNDFWMLAVLNWITDGTRGQYRPCDKCKRPHSTRTQDYCTTYWMAPYGEKIVWAMFRQNMMDNRMAKNIKKNLCLILHKNHILFQLWGLVIAKKWLINSIIFACDIPDDKELKSALSMHRYNCWYAITPVMISTAILRVVILWFKFFIIML